MSLTGYFLVGPTASGKTEIAHVLARRMSLPVLSIDSMQVYRGMDIGTAKPAPAERREFNYHGIDLVDPDCDFSLGDFVAYVASVSAEIGNEVIVCGGTGLYAKALGEPFDPGPPPDPCLRKQLEGLFEKGGAAALRSELERIGPGYCDEMKDCENPRRLMRAIERARSGRRAADSWRVDSGFVMTGLVRDKELLAQRISERAKAMFAGGLVDEVEGLMKKYGKLGRTASQAIGYCEALALLDGSIDQANAVETTRARTRQLAKKQRTWFRHQAQVDWIDAGQADAEKLADKVEDSWRKRGGVCLLPGLGHDR